MKCLWGVAISVIFVSGCASDMESQLRYVKEEIYREMRNQNSNIRDDLRKEIKDVEVGNKKDIKDLQSSLKSEINDLREAQRKYSMETDRTIIDHQKQIFQNQTVMQDSARRVYLLEALLAAKVPVASQTKNEGYITYIEDKNVSISIGTVNGIKTGDIIDVYRDKDKIGTIEIEVVDLNSSKGKLLESSMLISVGDRVELTKK